jgi:RNA polymerase sigma factor (sigma-70 family)
MIDRMTDSQLLAEFSTTQSPEAFATLVRRYVDLAYGTARRTVGDGHLAHDITQAVFLVLAKKAHKIDPATLPGWIVKTARLTAREAMRSKLCRERHETRAAQMRTEIESSPQEPTADDLAPLLDDALSRLSDVDRSTVAMRYLQGRTFAEVAMAAGISEEAARKRVSRAIEKLRTIFKKQGVVLSAGGLVGALAAQEPVRAPAAVTIAITSGKTAASLTLAKATLLAMTFKKVKSAAIVLLFAFLVGGLGVGLDILRLAMANTPTSSPSAPATNQPPTNIEWSTFAANFDASRATIRTLSAHFNAKYETNRPGTKVVNATLFWALDGPKEMLEKNIDEVTGQYVKTVFDGDIRCDIHRFADGTKQVEIIERPTFNATNLVDRFFFGGNFFRQSLSDYLKDWTNHKATISIDHTEADGRPITLLTWSTNENPPKYSGSLWFDTRKNAIIRGQGNLNGKPELLYTIDELREVSPGLWLPTKFTMTMLENPPDGRSRWSTKTEYSAQDLEVNHPVDPRLFDTTPPKNSFVRDDRTGKSYHQ